MRPSRIGNQSMPVRVFRLMWVLPAVALLALAGGCGKNKSVIPTGMLEADKFLFERGNELIAKKKWFQSRENYRQLVDNYPQSTYRPDAKLGLGDTYLGEDSAESLVLAQNEYREFLTFYPTHPRADYAQFKLGMCHFGQMLAADRDQTETKEAVAELMAFVQRYPNSMLIAEGRQKLRAARDRLSEADYKVGYFYFRSRWYPGAIDRLKGVLKDDPEYTGRDGVYYYLAESLMKMGRPAEALPYYDRLVKEFEKSEYLAKAKTGMADAQARMQMMQAATPPKKDEPVKKDEPKKQAEPKK
jgi:outer membrane protein assembly factor BamD